MHIVGGVYDEFCHHPHWHQAWGSGGRAAFAVSRLHHVVQLHTYARNRLDPVFTDTARANGIRVKVYRSMSDVRFEYWNPQVSPTAYYRPRLAVSPSIVVEADNVLRFGMLEGDAVVHAQNAVYDPQSADSPAPFRRNGSTAKHLALVLNQQEARALSGRVSPIDAAKSLLERESASAVVIKCGPLGALVVEQSARPTWVPCYKTPDVWPLGSGDVFSAVFASYWTRPRTSAVGPARIASKATALYCASRSLPIPANIATVNLADRGITSCKTPAIRGRRRPPRVYLASPFFRMGETWVTENIRHSLSGLGLAVLSPLHDVGLGLPLDVAPKDLRMIRKADLVFAVLGPVDAGTLFEIGYARSLGIPVVAFVDNVQQHELTMLSGTGCDISSDLSTALYRAAWVAYEL